MVDLSQSVKVMSEWRLESQKLNFDEIWFEFGERKVRTVDCG